MGNGTVEIANLGRQIPETAGETITQAYTNDAAHTIPGSTGGSANTDITSWPHILASHTATGAGTSFNLPSGRATVQASGANNGGTFTSATIVIEVSDDNVNWITLGTIALSGDGDSDGFVLDAPWAYIRSNATAFSETGSTPTVTVTLMI